MNSIDPGFYMELETKVWDALKNGDAQADAALLTEDFLGVYSTGMAGKADHASQLKNGPSVLEFSLSDASAMELAEGVVLLTYFVTFSRPRGGETSMYITSIWQKRNGTWLNVFSQDTEATP